MQRFVNGLLSSNEFKETIIGEEIASIMKADQTASINSSIANSLAEIIETATVKSRLDEDPETDIDFELALETSKSEIRFSNEFVELEQNISDLEIKIGRPDLFKHSSIKIMLAKIIKGISKLNMKDVDKMKKKIALLQKEIQSMHSSIAKQQIIGKGGMSPSDLSMSEDGSIKVIGVDSSYNKSVVNEVNTLYELAERSLYDMEILLSLVSRLKGVKKIHDKSPTIQQNINAIEERTSLINELNANNRSEIISIKKDINKELGDILKELDQWEKEIQSL